MTTNLTTSYMAIQTERAELDRTASRGWQAQQAASSSTRTPSLTALLNWTGHALIAAGEHLQGSSGRLVETLDARERAVIETPRSPARAHS